MMFIDIITWEQKDNDEVLLRFVKWEYPEGINVIGEWADLSSCRYVVVYDAENADAYAAGTLPWRYICKFDSFPVREPIDVMRFMAQYTS
ncbi:MAG: hypothetical protein JXA98_04460 [Methanosarcinaceae archaeon]|nr:hypothetical protein [Methanosarcinaceae archaeon]